MLKDKKNSVFGGVIIVRFADCGSRVGLIHISQADKNRQSAPNSNVDSWNNLRRRKIIKITSKGCNFETKNGLNINNILLVIRRHDRGTLITIHENYKYNVINEKL